MHITEGEILDIAEKLTIAVIAKLEPIDSTIRFETTIGKYVGGIFLAIVEALSDETKE